MIWREASSITLKRKIQHSGIVCCDLDEVAEASARCDVSGGAGMITKAASSIARVDACDGEDADAGVIMR